MAEAVGAAGSQLAGGGSCTGAADLPDKASCPPPSPPDTSWPAPAPRISSPPPPLAFVAQQNPPRARK